MCHMHRALMVGVLMLLLKLNGRQIECSLAGNGNGHDADTDRPSHANADGATNTTNNEETVTLELWCTETAVLDSEAVFYVKINDTRGKTKEKYKIKWSDQIQQEPNYTNSDGAESNLTKVYRNVEPGMYYMTVAVYDETFIPLWNKLAEGSMNFQLTETLNGVFNINQSWPYHRVENVISSSAPLVLSLNLTDNIEPVESNFTWTVDNSSRATHQPSVMVQIPHEGTYLAEVYVSICFPGKTENVTRFGWFKNKLVVKDPISNVRMIGHSVFPIRRPIDVKITSLGSFPISICTNILASNRLKPMNKTCMLTTYENTRIFPVEDVVNDSGTYQLSVTVQNYVNYETRQFYFSTYDPGKGHSLSVALPVVFITLGIIIVIIAIILHCKYNRPQGVEVANFGFHGHSLIHSASRLRKVFAKLHLWINRKRHTKSPGLGITSPMSSRRNSISSCASSINDSDSIHSFSEFERNYRTFQKHRPASNVI